MGTMHYHEIEVELGSEVGDCFPFKDEIQALCCLLCFTMTNYEYGLEILHVE